MAESRPITFDYNGRTVTVTRGTGPSADIYLFLRIDDGGEWFIGHYTAGMTRRDVKAKALAWLREHDERQARAKKKRAH